MMNDQLDLSMLDEQRKKALQALMQRMQANAQRSAGLNSLNQAGGGLGRQRIARFRPLAMRNVGILGRFGPRPGGGVDRFGIAERLPGARDPGAVPGLGGVPADMGTQAPAARSEMGVPAPAPGGGGGAGVPQVSEGAGGVQQPAGTMVGPQGQQTYYVPGSNKLIGGLSPEFDAINAQITGVPQTSGPSGYVNVGGVPVPLALFKALRLGSQQSAEGI
jgi:hypothetical protein